MTNGTIDAKTKPDETSTFSETLEVIKKTNAKVDAENRRLAAENKAANKANIDRLDGIIYQMNQTNKRLTAQLREFEPWRYSDSRFKRGCSCVWRGIKYWFNAVVIGSCYIALSCLFMLIVHWIAQAGGMIAGFF